MDRICQRICQLLCGCEKYTEKGLCPTKKKCKLDIFISTIDFPTHARSIQIGYFFKLPLQKYILKTKMETDERVSFLDVYNEFNQNIAERFKITKFKSKVRIFYVGPKITTKKDKLLVVSACFTICILCLESNQGVCVWNGWRSSWVGLSWSSICSRLYFGFVLNP